MPLKLELAKTYDKFGKIVNKILFKLDFSLEQFNWVHELF